MEIGSVIKKAREHRQLTQGSLAKDVGVTQTYLSLIESNKKMPSVEVMRKIAEILGINLGIIWIMSSEPRDFDKEERAKVILPLIKDLIRSII